MEPLLRRPWSLPLTDGNYTLLLHGQACLVPASRRGQGLWVNAPNKSGNRSLIAKVAVLCVYFYRGQPIMPGSTLLTHFNSQMEIFLG